MAVTRKQLLITIAAGDTSPLGTFAATLTTPGSSGLLPGVTWGGTDIPNNDDFNWNNKWFLDEGLGIGYGATKNAGDPVAMQHFVYDRANNIFRAANCGFNKNGHVYDAIAYKRGSSQGYLMPGGSITNQVYRTTLSAGSNPPVPTLLATAPSGGIMAGSGNFVTGESSMEHHPNLFAPGDGGVLILCQFGVLAMRDSTLAFSTIIPAGQFSLADTPAMMYSRGLDAVIVTTNSSSKAYRINAGGTWTAIDNTPMYFGPDRGSPDTAALIDDPVGAATVWAIEKVPSGRVWKLTSGTSWSLQASVAQPMTASSDSEDWMIAADRLTGCFVAIERTGTTGRVRVVRPWS